ncbi:hypothetical protein C8Q70DRAFT_970739 [Cubamyces menziesii]|nr:hypothetical protein C8Q70DRAFT_970739 [Cubamyces menziesii]
MDNGAVSVPTHSGGGPAKSLDSLSCIIAELEHPPDDTSSPYPRLHKKTRLPQLFTDTVLEMRSWGVIVNMMIPFWDEYQSSVAAFGFQFCDLRDSHWWVPGPTPAAPTPYAIRCSHGSGAQPSPIRFLPNFGCARNTRQQDLFIKLIDKGTAEDQIYRYLAGCKVLYHSSAFPCVLPPTAIIGSPYKFAFVAMPMWGTRFDITEFNTLREVFAFIRCTLTGLSFLHDHRIVHRDIHETNIAVNWYCLDVQQEGCSERRHAHYRSSDALYALFDFDLALQLPPSTSLKECRRPAYEALYGKADYHPFDTAQCERHYNPFAYDVACLGYLFIYHFTEAIPVAPLLAILFSRMTMHVSDDRFTAAEALAFFRGIETGLPPDVLDSSVALKRVYKALFDPEIYWSRLSPEDSNKWQSYRPPPLPWTDRIIRWLTTTDPIWRVVAFVRRSLHI